jgi:hypothetical protein
MLRWLAGTLTTASKRRHQSSRTGGIPTLCVQIPWKRWYCHFATCQPNLCQRSLERVTTAWNAAVADHQLVSFHGKRSANLQLSSTPSQKAAANYMSPNVKLSKHPLSCCPQVLCCRECSLLHEPHCFLCIAI